MLLLFLSLLTSKKTKSNSGGYWGKEGIGREDAGSLSLKKKKKREKLACGTEIGRKAKLPISIVFGNLNVLVLPSKERMTLAESISGIDGEV